jgi:hypothetical protein
MSRHIATASRTIPLSAETVYRIIANYRLTHPMILPKQYFLSLDVEEGGFGAGTIVNFDMRLLGQRRSFHVLITEPDPGRLLVETDIQSQTPTSFRIEALGNQQTRVTITTELSASNFVEGWTAKIMLQKVYREELLLLEKVAGSGSGVDTLEKANEN